MSTEPRFLANSSSYNINLPNGAPPPKSNEKPPEIINLKLDTQGKIFWNGQPVENKQALENLIYDGVKKVRTRPN